MEDGVVVLDANDVVVDLNPAAHRPVHSLDQAVIGQPATRLPVELPSAYATPGKDGESVQQICSRMHNPDA